MAKALWTTAFPKQARNLSRHSTLTRKRREKAAKSSRQKQKRANPISSRRRQNLKQYAAIKREWKSRSENQRCILTGSQQVEIHHTWGRIGELLCLQRLWLAVSRKAHDFIRDNPKLAAKAGLSAPVGLYNSIPHEWQIRAHEYRVAWLRCIIWSDEALRPVRPLLLAVKVCEEVENDMKEVAETKFWLGLR